MNYCINCGNKLIKKELKNEGLIPFCNCCNEYRFPIFSCAISTIIVNKNTNKVLLVKQYGTGKYRLPAGYVNKGESAEETLVREMKEELSINLISYEPLKTIYYEKSNTLMINYLSYVNTEEINPNEEIDEYAWFEIKDLLSNLSESKIAYQFVEYFSKKHPN